MRVISKIIAFDLSLSNSGFAVGEVVDGKLNVIEYGTIGTKRFSKHPLGYRLKYIADKVEELYKRFPEATHVVKERSFSNGRITATQQIYKVVGVWELVSHLNNHNTFTDIPPTTIKKELTGNGRATKDEVATAVADLTGVDTKIDDESDALAVLITYCRQAGLLGTV